MMTYIQTKRMYCDKNVACLNSQMLVLFSSQYLGQNRETNRIVKDLVQFLCSYKRLKLTLATSAVPRDSMKPTSRIRSMDYHLNNLSTMDVRVLFRCHDNGFSHSGRRTGTDTGAD
jgi:hypothetical protein